MQNYHSVRTVAEALRPSLPQPVFRPRALKSAVRAFQKDFRGDIMFAVKTNPEPYVLKALHAAGVRAFDAASLQEVKRIRELFGDAVAINFMHTVKSRRAIAEAYHDHGVRTFSLDSHEELQKILEETGNARDLTLFVRLAIPNSYAELSLSDKFGINLADAVGLLRETNKKSRQIGVCFHVGSQCMHPDAYRIAIRMAWQVVRSSRVKVDFLDVGGGFPSIYPGMIPPALDTYFSAIAEEFEKGPIMEHTKLLAEPGRALVAESGATLVRVELRKGNFLYLNDGTYGSLFDAGVPQFIFPAKITRTDVSSNTVPYSFYGPTCDTLDFMKGPFYLPEDVDEGDYIEIGQLGAYGGTMATRFNGFGAMADVVTVEDKPLMSMYGGDLHEPEARLVA
jgi:ornithine decarboxylase